MPVVKADASGSAEAVLLKLQGNVSAKVETVIGIDITAKGEEEFNVVGAGISGEAGIEFDGGKIRVKVGAGATALFGGKLKGNIEIDATKLIDNIDTVIDQYKPSIDSAVDEVYEFFDSDWF